MLFSPAADTMRAPPWSRTQGEVHLTDNPADLDVITTGPGSARRNPSAQGNAHVRAHNRQLLGSATASDDEGGGTALPFLSFSDFKCWVVCGWNLQASQAAEEI